MSNINILLAGVGGQGTVLASKILARSAMVKCLNARTAETIGMAQRGGCVVSHVRIGEQIYSPLISKGHADVIIGFEPSEAVRVFPYLKAGGTVVVSSAPVKPITDALSKEDYSADAMLDFLKAQNIRLIVADGAEIIRACGTAKTLNVALLGAAASVGAIGLSVAELKGVIRNSLSPKFYEVNLKALELGEKAAMEIPPSA